MIRRMISMAVTISPADQPKLPTMTDWVESQNGLQRRTSCCGLVGALKHEWVQLSIWDWSERARRGLEAG
jgi:hypothetical protein